MLKPFLKLSIIWGRLQGGKLLRFLWRCDNLHKTCTTIEGWILQTLLTLQNIVFRLKSSPRAGFLDSVLFPDSFSSFCTFFLSLVGPCWKVLIYHMELPSSSSFGASVSAPKIRSGAWQTILFFPGAAGVHSVFPCRCGSTFHKRDCSVRVRWFQGATSPQKGDMYLWTWERPPFMVSLESCRLNMSFMPDTMYDPADDP